MSCVDTIKLENKVVAKQYVAPLRDSICHPNISQQIFIFSSNPASEKQQKQLADFKENIEIN